MDQSFFEESREQSVIKSRIVAKYFWAWAKVIIPTAKKADGRIAYIDLFAGPGRYGDGTVSTPLKVLQQAISDPDMSNMLVTLFNDKDSENAQSLQRAISELPGIERMKFSPQVKNQEVGTEIVQLFGKMKLIPTFFFVDPWGANLKIAQLVFCDFVQCKRINPTAQDARRSYPSPFCLFLF